jgi:acyl-CoA dehydrogenase
VTAFPHVRRLLIDAYMRILAMKLYAARCSDYERSANGEDRRYLLFNPIAKLKVTSEGERVIDLLWEVIAARGFEKDTYFSQAAGHIRALPKLEGTVHVNLALVLKFLPAYLAAGMGQGAQYPEVPVRLDSGDDAFLFAQGRMTGLGRIAFADWRPAFERFADLPNVSVFRSQIEALGELLAASPPAGEQARDLDFLLNLGQIFAQVVYAQLTAEAAAASLDGKPNGSRAGTTGDLSGLAEAHVDRIFGIFVQDVSEYAVALHGQASTTDAQRAGILRLVRAPVSDAAQEAGFHDEVVAYSAWKAR